jgi:hypothetical protein
MVGDTNGSPPRSSLLHLGDSRQGIQEMGNLVRRAEERLPVVLREVRIVPEGRADASPALQRGERTRTRPQSRRDD